MTNARFTRFTDGTFQHHRRHDLHADTTHDDVVLVDKHDREIGLMPKLEAHRLGRCHRAISVIVRDLRGRFLLHQRAARKYHSGGLWTNTCCSHPWPGEKAHSAAARRLMDEMGMAAPLTPLFSMRYRARVSEQLIEHEFLHVYGGISDEAPQPNAREVADWCWMAPADLLHDVRTRPEAYTIWFRKILRDYEPELIRFAPP